MTTITVRDLPDAGRVPLTRESMQAIVGGVQLSAPTLPSPIPGTGLPGGLEGRMHDLFAQLGLALPATETAPGATCSTQTSVTGDGGDTSINSHCEVHYEVDGPVA